MFHPPPEGNAALGGMGEHRSRRGTELRNQTGPETAPKWDPLPVGLPTRPSPILQQTTQRTNNLRRLAETASFDPRRMRMSVFVGLSQTTRADVSIDLSRRQTLVTKEFLNGPEVGTAVEQMRRKTVTQRVR